MYLFDTKWLWYPPGEVYLGTVPEMQQCQPSCFLNLSIPLHPPENIPRFTRSSFYF